MQVPGNWESRGLEDFDGVVWFTRTIEAPQGAGEMTLSLGRISNTAEVWVNGLSVAQNATPPPAAAPPRRPAVAVVEVVAGRRRLRPHRRRADAATCPTSCRRAR